MIPVNASSPSITSSRRDTSYGACGSSSAIVLRHGGWRRFGHQPFRQVATPVPDWRQLWQARRAHELRRPMNPVQASCGGGGVRCRNGSMFAGRASKDDFPDRLRQAHSPSSTPPPPSRRLAPRAHPQRGGNRMQRPTACPHCHGTTFCGGFYRHGTLWTTPACSTCLVRSDLLRTCPKAPARGQASHKKAGLASCRFFLSSAGRFQS
jgi:hypothetical protein